MLESLGEFNVLLRLKIDISLGGGGGIPQKILCMHKAEDKKAGTDGLVRNWAETND